MSAFDEWWESVACVNPEDKFRWHALKGWNAAIKHMESKVTPTNTTRDAIALERRVALTGASEYEDGVVEGWNEAVEYIKSHMEGK